MAQAMTDQRASRMRLAKTTSNTNHLPSPGSRSLRKRMGRVSPFEKM